MSPEERIKEMGDDLLSRLGRANRLIADLEKELAHEIELGARERAKYLERIAQLEKRVSSGGGE